MGVFVGSDGNISIFRVGIIAGVLGAIVIVGGFALFSLEQAANRQPLEVVVPESATLVATEDLSSFRRLYYESPESPEAIAIFYDGKLTEFYGDSPDRQFCVRLPSDGTMPGYIEGNGSVPYEFRCLFSASSINIERYTEVLIQPGVRNDTTGEDYSGRTRIELEQIWEP